MTKITPVVLAGGAGTRLWPISRESLPKQFLPIIGNRTSYQDTLLRVSDKVIFTRPIVITGDDFRFFAKRQAEEVGIEPIVIIEPTRRDSGPALAAAALFAKINNSDDAVLLALAADHVILDPEEFLETCMSGLPAAEQGRIVTFGILPSAAKTSYGYVRPGENTSIENVCVVQSFVEKPDAVTAAQYVKDGYLWNSGNFLFKADVLLNEIGKFEPDILSAVEHSVSLGEYDLGFFRLDSSAFARSPQKSIDYAVLEKTALASVIAGKFRWSDIGSWDSVFEISNSDNSGNVINGSAVVLESQDSMIHSPDRLTAVLGLKDMVVVSTADAVLVAPRDRAQEVRELVTLLKSSKKPEAKDHRRGHRPWGFYDSIDGGDRFHVKRLVVYPGGVLSRQKHYHRSEHWVVVRGTAEVTIGDNTTDVHENESVFISMGQIHRLANRGKIPLELIEVQTGSYLGEDDIVRIEDIYSRK